MNHLAAAELHIRIAREESHARAAMTELARAKPSDPKPSDRKRRKGRSERLAGNAWRRAKRHMRRAAEARHHLAVLTGGAS